MLEEINKEGEALLNLGNVVIVGAVEGVLESRERREEAGDFVGEGIGGRGFVEEVTDAGTDRHHAEAGDENDRMVGAVGFGDVVEDAGENVRVKRRVTGDE